MTEKSSDQRSGTITAFIWLEEHHALDMIIIIVCIYIRPPRS